MASEAGAADLGATTAVKEDDPMLKRMEERQAARRAAQERGEVETPAPQASQPTNGEQAEEAAEQPAPDAPEVQRAEFAILVIKNEDGSFAITPNLNLPVVARKQPTNDDVWQAFHNILKDLQTQQIAQIAGQVAAQSALQAFQQLTQQMAQGQGQGAQSADSILRKVAQEAQQRRNG